MPALLAWLRAARPAALLNLVPPLLLGHALAAPFSWTVFFYTLLYALLMQLYIVFWNDWADAPADRLNVEPSPFSGGSRALPEGLLSARALFLAGLAAGLGVLCLGALLALSLSRPLAPLLFFAGLLLLWLYSLPPARLNYRGGGEVLQAAGCGLVLPAIAFYLQTGSMALPGAPLLPFFLLHAGAALAFALPDHRADRLAGKRTLPALLGAFKAAFLMVGLGLATLLCLAFSSLPAAASLPALPLLFVAACLVPSVERSRRALLLCAGLNMAPAALYPLGFCLAHLC